LFLFKWRSSSSIRSSITRRINPSRLAAEEEEPELLAALARRSATLW
jgi:hypothetical protein